jgi:N-acetylneuraminic acid mutarotase
MFRFFVWVTTAMMSLGTASTVSAHFLWLVIETQPGPTAVKVYFGEHAEPDDPALLDRFGKLEGWSIPGGRSEPQRLSFTKKNDALEAELPTSAATAPVVLRHTYGVISRGGETFLLNYYAKTYPTALPGTWRAIDSKEHLPLEIVPELTGKNNVQLRVTWQGKPAAGAEITIIGPQAEMSEGVADENGVFKCEATVAGKYSIRARHIEKGEGEHEGQKYASIRHYTTLTLPFSPAQLSSRTDALPDLPQPTTSFGGAIVGDSLYVYGGNYGDAHDYSNEGQSGDFWKLNLQEPVKWQRVMTGPKLQGLAMVEYQGALYRIGGFTALNKAGEEQNLKSQAEFARFNAGKQNWDSLPPMPEPRSSHDAAVLENKLYVVGGWDLRGDGKESKWHETALRMDLATPNAPWTPIAPPPFKRRAVAVAAWQGKIYCIGGMQEKGGTTTAVAIYDPETNSWSDGPSLLGTSMDGFGASAFASHGRLYVTTMSGSIQRLSQDGKIWEFVGQLNHPRFFHRLLPWNNQLVAVGGAHMSVGKIEAVEVIEVKE